MSAKDICPIDFWELDAGVKAGRHYVSVYAADVAWSREKGRYIHKARYSDVPKYVGTFVRDPQTWGDGNGSSAVFNLDGVDRYVSRDDIGRVHFIEIADPAAFEKACDRCKLDLLGASPGRACECRRG